MKAYAIQGGFGIDYVEAVDRPIPEAGPGEVLIKLRAASLNPRDIGVLLGYYDPGMKMPLIPLSDGVGEVVALGENVKRFKLGERVSGIFHQRWISGEPDPDEWRDTLGFPIDGMLAEYAVLPEQGLVKVPEYLTDVEAAALPCAGVTAWDAVVVQGKVKAGDIVVVQGTGSVSLFAMQFAKLHGATVIITSSSDEKLERAKALGTDYGINYVQTPEWDKAVLEWTHGRGADLIVDLGGASTLNRSIQALRLGGQIGLVGILSGVDVNGLSIVSLLQKRARLHATNVGSRDMFEAMNRAITKHQLRPVVDRVFPFEQAIEALRDFTQSQHFGKVCITF